LALDRHETALDASLCEMVRKLLKRFSSGEGYAAFEDAIPTSESDPAFAPSDERNAHIRYELIVQCLHEELDVATAVVSNGDSRLRKCLYLAGQ
jgi:hypothetical protein